MNETFRDTRRIVKLLFPPPLPHAAGRGRAATELAGPNYQGPLLGPFN